MPFSVLLALVMTFRGKTQASEPLMLIRTIRIILATVTLIRCFLCVKTVCFKSKSYRNVCRDSFHNVQRVCDEESLMFCCHSLILIILLHLYNQPHNNVRLLEGVKQRTQTHTDLQSIFQTPLPLVRVALALLQQHKHHLESTQRKENVQSTVQTSAG